jgi:glycosyltransferase involved in cell wall biosynthesis
MINANINNPLISIIMNCRNGEEYLRESIDSIYAQSYANWEIIFWDNASTDGSAAIAKSYDSKLRYFKSDQSLTLGKARNLAMAEARGKYLAFLDCDDLWLSQKLEKQVNILETKKDIDFVYGNYFRMIMPETNRLILGLKGGQPQGDVFGRFLYNYPVNLQTVMLRMSAVSRMDAKFDDRFEVSEEFDFFMRMLFKSKALYLNEPLAIYRIHENMISNKLPYKFPVEMANILNKLKRMDDLVQQKYTLEIKYYEAKLGYWGAKAEMEKGNPKAARSKLAPYKFMDAKFFILYFLTCLPKNAWRWAHRYKMKS